MKYFLMAAALLLATSTAAIACSGTEEYPAAVKQLEENQNLVSSQKAIMMKVLLAGMAKHDEAHKTNNMSQMGQSLKTLQTLKPKISQ